MYIPKSYQEQDEHKLIEFMQVHNFATLISSANNIAIATHLPFVIEKRNGKLILVSHMAKANPQCQSFLENELLTIFHGPHAFISPKHYEKQQNVPTWNYIAVHAYGKATVIDKQEDVINLMERTIHFFEKEFYPQWKNLSPEYIHGMLKAIVAFEIEVTKIDGQYKLSQDKTKKEQQTIISAFEKSNDSVQLEVANEMKKNLE